MKTQILIKNVACVLLSLTVLAACKKDEPGPIQGPKTDIYVAGSYKLKNNLNSPCYWKNGEFFPVKDSSILTPTVNDFLVYNNAVYIIGAYENGKPCLWKNGEKFNLSANSGLYGGAQSVILLNNALYITGAIQAQVNGSYYATVWKVEDINGTPTVTKTLSINTNTPAWAFGITAVGQNLYVCGKDKATGKLGYWMINSNLPDQAHNFNILKNNLAQDATGQMTGITGLNQDVYIFGGYDSDADYFYNYWKNGNLEAAGFSWTLGTFSALALDANGQVYIAGISKQNNKPGYWKGQERVDFTSGSAVDDIFVNGADIYAAGHDNLVACYWKNGTMVSLNRPQSSALKIKVYTN